MEKIKAVNDQYELKSKLGEKKKENPKRKSKKNLEVIENVDNLYNSRQAANDFSIEYTEEFQKPHLDQKEKEQGLKY